MNARLSIVAACASAALTLTACGTTPTTVQQTTTSTPTTTSEAPGADPTAWFEAYCGPMGVAAIASFEPQRKAAEGMAAVQEAVVSWASLVATSDRKIADDIEKLGPLSSDVQNPHERLIKALRKEAEGYDDVAARLRVLEANDVFPERYQQVMATRGGGRDSAEVMFKQIVDIPKYGEIFRSNEVCVGWQKLSKSAPGK